MLSSTTPTMPMAFFRRIFSFFFSPKSKLGIEKILFIGAIFTFLTHFLLIMLANGGYLPLWLVGTTEQLNPVDSIYTPFSIILIFEVYLLIFYLPASITSYLGRQYEVITLIFIRNIFSDLSALSAKDTLIDFENITMISFSFAGLLVLFLLIFCFYKLSGRKPVCFDEDKAESPAERRFILSKKVMSVVLMFVFIVLFIRSIFSVDNVEFTIANIPYMIKTASDYFFSTLFIALILSEVLLLLLTFNLTDKFHKIMRNSGFIISTILLKISFMVEGVNNMLVVLIAIAFGVAVQGICRLYEKKIEMV